MVLVLFPHTHYETIGLKRFIFTFYKNSKILIIFYLEGRRHGNFWKMGGGMAQVKSN